MVFTLTPILFGAGLGALLSGLLGSYLVVTRSYRRVRNPLAIGFGYIFFIGSSMASLLLLIRALEALGVQRHSPQGDAALFSYIVGLACGVFLAGRGEVRWRKSVGLDGKNLILKQQRKN